MEENKTSPSALIPFCDFGGSTSAVGVKVEQFNVNVCNSFQAKIFDDRVCYEVDLDKISNKNNIEKELEQGFNFLMDYNEDRQVTSMDEKVNVNTDFGISTKIVKSDQDKHAFIYLNSIGKQYFCEAQRKGRGKA